jgi:lantibiotic transport system permease protein
MFLDLLNAELIKVRSCAAPYVLLGGPILLALLVFPMMTGPRPPHSWDQLLSGTLQIWTLLILPLNATMFAASYGQIEHRVHGWDFLAAVPVDRWKIYFAKIIVALLGLLLLQFFFLFGVIASAGLASILFHKELGDLALTTALRANALIWVASLLMLAIQLWASFRLSNFVAPVMVGMTGTIIAIAAVVSHRSEAAYLPWAFPGHAFNPPAVANIPTLLASLLGGAIVLLLTTIDLIRREIT